MMKEKLKRIDEVRWLIDKEVRDKMRVSALIYGTENIIREVEDAAIEQLTNVACLPGVIEPVIGAPDIHWGYGLPMGAVGAFDDKEGIISAGCTGFDINCGIRMIKTNLTREEIKPKLTELMEALFEGVPSGVGAKGKLKVTNSELEEVLVNGAEWAVENNYGVKKDLERMEENGRMKDSDPSKVSDTAKKRGLPQLGTLGAGNHFLEVQAVGKIYEEETANAFGINEKDQVVIMLHCGSRGLGHQVATDYLKVHAKAAEKYHIWLPDRQLVCAPTESEEGQDYWKAMKAAVNYAFCNRTVMTQWVRECFEKVMKQGWEEMGMDLVYDVTHNICKLEEHKVEGKKRKLYVHRKGATRALPPKHELLPEAYKSVGQPVLIAGSMGTASYVLVGTEGASESFYSTCHGAGRVMSRHKAIQEFKGQKIKEDLETRKGEVIRATNPKLLAEEAPAAYKDIDEVIESVHKAGISLKVARMVPLGVTKG